MPSFTIKEIRVLLTIGGAALLAGILMFIIGSRGLSQDFGVPEYMVSLRNTGVTIVALSLLWSLLALYRMNHQAR